MLAALDKGLSKPISSPPTPEAQETDSDEGSFGLEPSLLRTKSTPSQLHAQSGDVSPGRKSVKADGGEGGDQEKKQEKGRGRPSTASSAAVARRQHHCAASYDHALALKALKHRLAHSVGKAAHANADRIRAESGQKESGTPDRSSGGRWSKRMSNVHVMLRMQRADISEVRQPPKTELGQEMSTLLAGLEKMERLAKKQRWAVEAAQAEFLPGHVQARDIPWGTTAAVGPCHRHVMVEGVPMQSRCSLRRPVRRRFVCCRGTQMPRRTWACLRAQ